MNSLRVAVYSNTDEEVPMDLSFIKKRALTPHLVADGTTPEIEGESESYTTGEVHVCTVAARAL